MKKVLVAMVLLLSVSGFSFDCKKKKELTKEQKAEINAREDSRVNALLFKKETGNYSGYNMLFPIYSYHWNTKKDRKEFSAVLSLMKCKKHGDYSKKSFLWGQGFWSKKKKGYNHKSVGPLGLLWYELENKNVKTKNILWGFLWRHRVKADVETKKFTPFFIRTKNHKTGKGRVNILWFFSFPTS